MPHNISTSIEQVGTVAYVVEDATQRPLYSLNPTASGWSTSHSSLKEAVFADAATYAGRLQQEPTLESIVRLLSQSTQITDGLQAFLTVWAALEIFLDKTFKSTYEEKMFATFKAAVAPPSELFVKRLREVMSGKYNIRDKFVVVASALDDVDAASDIETFKRLKDVRDGVHSMSIVSEALPINKTRNLLRKYLRLHLAK